MFRVNSFIAAPALSLLLCGTAHAALTADQVWQSWKDAAATAGLSITAATEANSGGVLTLNGVVIAPEGAPVGLTISDLTMTEESDGTVTIQPGAAIGVDFAEGTNATKIAVTHEDLTIVAAEEEGAMVYGFGATKLDVAFDVAYEGYALDGATPAPVVKNTGTVGFVELEGAYSDTPGANRAFGMDLAAAKMAYTTNSDDPGLGMKNASTSETADVAIGFGLTLPSTTPLAGLQSAGDFRKALEEGFAFDLVFESGVSSGTASAEDEFFPYQMAMTSQPASLSMSFDKDTFEAVSGSDGFQLDMTTSAMPAPIKVSAAASSMTILMPVMATTPADVVLKMAFNQLMVNDEVWGMFDPGAALKREPLDLNVDVSGKTTLDLIGMAEADETGAMPPIPAPERLDITDITLKVAGAALNATGAFTFDNSMGIPAPLGEATVNVSGANALIDGLIATGIITEDDAMGARMMMGMFMAPGAEPDSLTSKIEAKEGFAIFVNGQQIQ